MSKVQERKLEELQEKVRILEEENSYLSENKEELLLLGLISEQIELEKNEQQLLGIVLEKISILKDIPFCAVFEIQNKSPKLICSYTAFQKTEPQKHQVFISEDLLAHNTNEVEILDIANQKELLHFEQCDNHFMPKTAIIIPFKSLSIPNGFFLFCYDQQNTKECSRQLLLLLRATEISISKIDNLSLVRELQQTNAKLDQKVKEQTKELLESNKNLQLQIEEQKKLKDQFYQSQKMEAIGKLAGGVAHDFNNLLTIINGYSEMMLLKTDRNDDKYENLEQIHLAGNRAANLTNQLLAFSRKQVAKPQIININDVLIASEKMLQRLIGEDIFLQTILEPELGLIKVDAGQVEQIVMNLVVNARDAMPQGGNITINTKNVKMTDHLLLFENNTISGNYCLLSVSDNGCGMTEETQSHIFEPFYTTKEKGEGTGLGLSTVFGIVKQNNGHINLISSVGKGSTFEIYLPLIDAISESNISRELELQNFRGSETILVVEDDLHVQRLATNILLDVGYRVLTANDAFEALEIIKKEKKNIDLLLTDVIMPGQSGKDLAQLSLKHCPNIKVLFMSGYTNDIIAKYGLLTNEIEYIQKPFTIHVLIKRVRDVLDKKK